jgi:hypothetical protein
MKWYTLISKTFFDLSGKRRMGEVLRGNKKTIWVKVKIGCKSAIIIKRHRIKHHVLTYIRPDHDKGVYDDEIIHSTTGD